MHTHADRPSSFLSLTSHGARLSLLAVLVFGLSGCGFVFVNGPPAGHENMNYFSCTESNAGPILDGVWGGLNLAGALTAASDPDAYVDSGQIIAGGLLWTGVSTAAAIVGSNKTSDCREAKQALAERQARGAAGDSTPDPDSDQPPEQ